MSFEYENSPHEDRSVPSPKALIETVHKKLDAERQQTGNREFRGMMIKLRESPWLAGPLKTLTALLAGVPLIAHAGEASDPPRDLSVESSFSITEPEEGRDETDSAHLIASEELSNLLLAEQPFRRTPIEQASDAEFPFPESDEVYLLQLADLGKTIEAGQAAPEYYARVGRPEWTPYQRSLFSASPVHERFFELHPEYRRLSPQDYVKEYPNMLQTAATEFRFSNEFRFVTDNVQTAFLEIAPKLKPEEALSQYKFILETMGRQVGLAHVIELSKGLQELLSTDHPIIQYMSDLDLKDAESFLKPDKKNIVHIDQANGQLRVLRKIYQSFLLIDSFPAIGGKRQSPEMSIVGKPSGSEYVHVPDVVMTVSSVDRAKTSWTWQRSWVSQDALIREQRNELQYQHPGTKQWYDLTGPKAAFFPDSDGNVIRPFDSHFEPMDQALIRAASHSNADQSVTFVPKIWTKEEIVSWNGGEIPSKWKWNDFGSTALRLSLNGERTNINIHSKPNEDPNDFLGDRTHGCIATYSEYMKQVVDLYGVRNGTTVVVTNTHSYDLKKQLAHK